MVERQVPAPSENAIDVGAAIDEPHLSDDVLELGEEVAVERFLDAFNTRRLRVVTWGLAVVMTVYAMILFAEHWWAFGVLALMAVAVDLGLIRGLGRIVASGNVRPAIAAVLAGHLVVASIIHWRAPDAVQMWFLMLVVAALRFRVSVGEASALTGALYAVLAVRLVAGSVLLNTTRPIVELVVWAVVAALGTLAICGLTHRRVRRYRLRWRSEAERQRDRLRMKRELQYAREIQLSMLPREAPQLEWLELAALSLPATEVGGDYYDYFRLDDRRLVVVVGDVTGHGVASGLVLSGVRSCLNLLQEELLRPAEVLERVNRMVKRTASPRMLMTLAVAVLDAEEDSVTVATAGHPPVLIVRRDGTVVEVGRGALPLGAMDEVHYAASRARVEPGDALLMLSDGVVEAVGVDGEQFGWRRLRDTLRAAPRDASARQLRDQVLRELWSFKGDAEQLDDVTMVAARWNGLTPTAENGV